MKQTYLDRRNQLGFVPSLPLALVLAAGAGWLMDFGFPDRDWWPMTLVGTALMIASVRGIGHGKALLVGVVGGFSFYGILIWWLTVYLGPIPWIALTLAQVFFFSMGLALVAVIWRYSSRQWPSIAGRLGVTPALVAGAWTLREAVAAVFPFGGFAWGRISQSQSESPLAELVAWVGTSGMSFLLAWGAALAVALVAEARVRWDIRAALGWSVLTALVVWPAWPVNYSGSIRVLAVQGNADAGLFAQYAPGDNLTDHYRVTQQLFDQGIDVDLIVWPENASDIDPLRSEQAAAVVSDVSRRLDAPLVVGAITRDGADTYNSMLLWDSRESVTEGPLLDQYDKIHPVPFAEYLPARDFFYPMAPSLFDMIPRDYSFGQRDALFTVEGIEAGVAICYDIVDDEILWSIMRGGAEIILAPTNNADFGRTDQSLQQLAIARMRAIETGRSVVNISTVGTSAIIDPLGNDIDRLEWYTGDYMLLDVPLANHTTPATHFGRSIELAVIGLALAGLVVAGAGHYQRYRRGRF